MNKSKEIIAFGDFQTPLNLAQEIAEFIANSLGQINTIIEPTCGLGSFIQAFIKIDTKIDNIIGWEINPRYVRLATQKLLNQDKNTLISIEERDFFQVNWTEVNNKFPNPKLFVGNPPWVTNSELGKLLSNNLPQKNNFQQFSGLDAITGKSNFDISEWILIKICQQISSTNSAMAFLVKTSVARKVYQYIVNNDLLISPICIRKIDIGKHFKVNVDACLFFAQGKKDHPIEYFCPMYSGLKTSVPNRTLGISNRKLISDIKIYNNLSDIDSGCEFKWRSGIKHDASKIMNFQITPQGLVNGFGEKIKIPNCYLYPMYKSSDIAKEILYSPQRMMLITQQKVGEDTSMIEQKSPETWQYLITHAAKLDARKSSIYKNSPRFAIFGVGDYSFKPWKIVISSLYKNIKFTKIGLYNNKPIVLDDTCYMLGFDTEAEADLILILLKSSFATSFINSLVFQDNKRVVTVTLLNRISLRAIALRLGLDKNFDLLFDKNAPKQLSIL